MDGLFAIDMTVIALFGTSIPLLTESFTRISFITKVSIATAGIGFYTGSALASWTGSLFVGGLLGTQLDRLALDGERVIDTEPLFEDLWHRVRAVGESPAQELYVLTENGVLEGSSGGGNSCGV